VNPGKEVGAAVGAPYYERVFGTTFSERLGKTKAARPAGRVGRTTERFTPEVRVGSFLVVS
jgi:hypothetical protein